MRSAVIERKTSETEIYLKLDVDGSGQYEVETGIGFLDHMLELFAKHGSFDLSIGCNGDLYVDMHHTVEDIGICLGKAFYEAVGDCKGIYRYGNMILPMDEALVLSAVDFGGRAYLGYDVVIPTEKVGDFDTELVKEFFIAFTSNAKINVHFKLLAGSNSHHIIEGMFKSVARAIKSALKIDPDSNGAIPSTKGAIV
jgi:imidazoleglycerol-phosphate dehydratase